MKRKVVKRKSKSKVHPVYVVVTPKQTAVKGDIDDYIYSWQSIKSVSER